MAQTGQEVNFNASPDKQSPNLNPLLQLKQILMYYMDDFEDFGNDATTIFFSMMPQQSNLDHLVSSL